MCCHISSWLVLLLPYRIIAMCSLHYWSHYEQLKTNINTKSWKKRCLFYVQSSLNLTPHRAIFSSIQRPWRRADTSVCCHCTLPLEFLHVFASPFIFCIFTKQKDAISFNIRAYELATYTYNAITLIVVRLCFLFFVSLDLVGLYGYGIISAFVFVANLCWLILLQSTTTS